MFVFLFCEAMKGCFYMTKQEKFLNENPALKKIALEILQSLNGESAEDCKQILDAVNYYVRNNAFFDAETARNIIEP